jgi:lysophospholipase L1-like esterase
MKICSLLHLHFRNTIFYAVVLVAVAFMSEQVRGEGGTAVQTGQKIAFMGDSITANAWAQPGGYVRLVVDGFLKQGIKITPIPAGVSGNTSKDMLARLDHDVLSKQPDWMTLSCGVNDVWHGANGVDLETYKQNMTSIVHQATAKGIKVILLTATPIGEDENANNKKLESFNDFLRQLAKENNLPLADLNADFCSILKNYTRTSASRILTVDGVHMNSNGNVVMAKGCLRAFGFFETDIEKVEQAWLNEPNTAFFSVGFDIRPTVALTLAQFRGVEKVAQSHNVDAARFRHSLWLRVMAEVIDAHAQDEVIDSLQVKKEVDARLVSKIDELSKK